MKKVIIAAAVALSALAGAAQAAEVSNTQFLQAARCRGLAASEGLGKLDTAGIDAFLKQETGARELPVRVSANNKISGAQKEGDKADGAKKEKLLAERSGACSAWLGGAATGAAMNTAN
ncbi:MULTISPECIES: hypothetical protein [Caulobacter]|jgi:hypothetical protein|uniref:Opacity protein-like surface antigen n=1 Tax=Caulobacter rhizosphaerae TaxID=2010972 RepID=A0ABU1MZM5_9CAUL|nr:MULTISPECIES: hypothetical protein [Caulobacter]KQZ30084.1 hypothetical protein ASD47_04780 [Caulobacter sp. Root1472]MDR6531151.1 opacity protein-like surface antigen [Caulobacter rhizosphaerae]GGL26490.1 hypothetical protein GCM10010983_24750 [Caulobacter rhizosphaerae]